MSDRTFGEEAAHTQRAARAFYKTVVRERAQLRRGVASTVAGNSVAAPPFTVPPALGPWGPWEVKPTRFRFPGVALGSGPMGGLVDSRVAGAVAALFLTLGLAAIGALAVGASYARSALATADSAPPSGHMFVARDGRSLGVHGAAAAAPVRLAELPKPVVQSVLAIEDKRFEQRLLPIDLRGSLRAAWINFRCHCTAQGGSTIAQQLAKQRLHDAVPTVGRKLREALVATYLQVRFGRQKVLEDYLNIAPFGHGYIGLRAAALGYFNTDPAQLSLSQAAELAGSLKASSKLNPAADPTASWQRAQIVLRRMVDLGYISPAESAAASQPHLALAEPPPSRGYLIDMLEAGLAGSRVIGRAGHYVTTIDMDLQAAAEQAVAASLPHANSLGAGQTALVAMRPDGTVLALVGGRDYAASKFNRATQAQRPIGSEVKTAIYAAALMVGYRPDDPIDDAPVHIGHWAPHNFDGAYEGRITLRQAFARSRNAATVRLALKVGLDRVIAVERRAGVNGPLTPSQPSFLLGSTALSPLQLASVFASLTNCAPVTPHTLDAGPRPKEACTGILDAPRHAELMDLLHAVLTSGTGRTASFPGDAACGAKTGTTSDFRDAWFAGACGGMVVVIWVGNDDDKPTRTEGGGLPAEIWRNFMVRAAQLHTK